MPKGKSRKKAPSEWRRTHRMINGEKRLVRVRRYKGKEQVRVVSPRNKKKKD